MSKLYDTVRPEVREAWTASGVELPKTRQFKRQVKRILVKREASAAKAEKIATRRLTKEEDKLDE